MQQPVSTFTMYFTFRNRGIASFFTSMFDTIDK